MFECSNQADRVVQTAQEKSVNKAAIAKKGKKTKVKKFQK